MSGDEAVLLRRGIRLEPATLGWNTIGASTVVIWQLRDSADERRGRLALRLIGLAFIGLAIYVTAQAAFTLIDAYLAGAVLFGLLLNAALGWWWADPLAGLVLVFYALREAREALA